MSLHLPMNAVNVAIPSRESLIPMLSDQLESSLVLERLLARVTLAFGALALTLAAVGLSRAHVVLGYEPEARDTGLPERTASEP
jgi:hypothetical protein